MDDGQAREHVARTEALLAEIEDEPRAVEALQAVVELYGEALARLVAGADPVEDELVSHLLLVHDLHPVDVESRVRRALDEVRPYLGSHGGDVELLGIEDGVALLRLEGSCNGCPSSAQTLRLAIEDAVQNAAPELTGIKADGVAEETPALLQIGSVRRESAWTVVGAPAGLDEGTVRVEAVVDEPVLFLRLDGTHYAYRERCPGCGERIAEAVSLDGLLTCRGCDRRYEVRRAGRCRDDPRLSLEPIPLLVDDAGLVRVALPAGVR